MGYQNICRKNPGGDNAKYMASCITILIINIPYFISVNVILIVWWILPDQISFHEIIFAWIPIITSGLNPIIVLSRKEDARKAVIGILKRLVGGKVERKQSTSSMSTRSSQVHITKGDATTQKATVIANQTVSEI